VVDLSPLDEKLRRVFPDEVVNKRLARLHQVSRLPRFISEYAVKRICGDDPSPADLARLSEFVSTYYPEPRDRDRILHELMSRGEYTILDEFRVSVDPKRGLRKVEIPSLGVRDAGILPEVLAEHRDLLGSGVWGIARLIYDPSLGEGGQTPIVVVEFDPIQYSGVDLARFKDGRAEFSTDEWIDVLMNTVGVNPSAYSRREKLLYLTRLVPLAEPNVNLMELGPRATGKSFVYKNISYYVRLYSGGSVSPAVLFFHGTLRTVGDLGVRDCVVFDEISKIRFSNPDEMVGKLKDYMESGEYERGMAKRIRSTCSIVFLGNLEVVGRSPAQDPLQVLPSVMRGDSALLDRIHGLLPGWELPKIEQPEVHLSSGYGFVADYFCEILHLLRGEDFRHLIEERVRLRADGGRVTIRDHKAIVRLSAGLLKLLFPHGEFSDDELSEVVSLAVEYRQRIHEMLRAVSPGEFEPKRLGFEVV